MTYKSIEEFLNDKPEMYDFSDDGASEEYEKMEGVEKYFNYKAVMDKAFVNLICVKEPDSESELLQDIYKLLWEEYIEKKYIENEKIKEIYKIPKSNIIQGETLNSVQTTFDKMYEFYQKPSHEVQRQEVVKKNIFKKQDISKKYMYTRYFCGIEEYKEDFSFVGVDFLEFLKTYHTLGNFMPVPVGCNGPRGIGAVKDYWDLTLKCIKNYYDTKDKETKDKYLIWVERIVGKKNENIYAQWLDCFGNGEKGRKNFVEVNFLQSFVDENGEPKELWKGHFEQWEIGKYSANAALPQTKEQCIEYFKTAKELIEKRTKTMIEKLKKIEVKESEAKV